MLRKGAFIMRVRKVDSDAIKLYEVKVKFFAPRLENTDC